MQQTTPQVRPFLDMEVLRLTFSVSNPSNPSNKGDHISDKCLRSLSDEFKVMPLQVKPFTVAVYSVASLGGGRQLYAFDTARLKKILQNFVIETLGGTLVDDWYEVATNGALDSVTAQAKDIGGFAYDLNFR